MASGVVAGWAVMATVVATGIHSSKGIGDYNSRGDCPILVTKDTEKGGAVAKVVAVGWAVVAVVVVHRGTQQRRWWLLAGQ